MPRAVACLKRLQITLCLWRGRSHHLSTTMSDHATFSGSGDRSDAATPLEAPGGMQQMHAADSTSAGEWLRVEAQPRRVGCVVLASWSVSGALPGRRVKCPGKPFRMLGADEEPLSVRGRESDAAVAAHVVRDT